MSADDELIARGQQIAYSGKHAPTAPAAERNGNGHHPGGGFFSDATPPPEPPEDFDDHHAGDGDWSTNGNGQHANNGARRGHADSSDEDDAEPQFTDFAALLDGGLPDPPKPSVLHRTDGVAIFYKGKVNDLYGDPADGKTMLVLAAAAEVLRNGGNALFIDLDGNGARETTERLLMLGVPAAVIVDQNRFRHCEPEDAPGVMDRVEKCAGWADFAIIDCVGELMPLFSASSDSADDYTRVRRQVTGALVKNGCAVALLDHQVKTGESRNYGAGGTMAKRRAVTGISINLVGKETFVRGQGGKAELWINKDRPGGLRPHCPKGKGRKQLAGIFILDPEDENGAVGWRLLKPLDVKPVRGLDEKTAEYLEAAQQLSADTFATADLALAIGADNPPTRSQLDKAAEHAQRLVDCGLFEVVNKGGKGRGNAATWRLPEGSEKYGEKYDGLWDEENTEENTGKSHEP
jgi:hypothetical protein